MDTATGLTEGVAAGPAEPDAGITRQDVVNAFRLLLGRAPENEAAIAHHVKLANLTALGEVIRGSAEFRFLHALDARRGGQAPPAATEPRIASLAQYDFDRDGTAVPLLGRGWSEPEPGSCWSVGTSSEIALPSPRPEPAGDIGVVVVATPFRPPQRLSILLDGVVLATVLARGEVTVGCRIPHRLIAGREIRLGFQHPDAMRPCDYAPSSDQRQLGFAFHRLELTALPPDPGGPSDAELMRHFESLGDNCEIGFVQRRCGVEPIGLLRFNSMPIEQLMRGLRTRFEGFPDRARMRLERHTDRIGGAEYIIYEDGYKLAGHTAIIDQHSIDASGEAALLDREFIRLGFLRRLLLEELEGDETIFVYKRNQTPDEAEIIALWLALRRLGGCTLLWVVPEEAGLPAGSVTMLGEGLLKGRVDRFAAYNDAENVSLACWLTLCRRTLRITETGSAATRQQAVGPQAASAA